MKKRLADLAERRRVLLKKIEAQRMAVTEISLRWETPMALADAGLNAVRFMRNHPSLVSGAVAAFLAWRRKGIVGLAREGWHLLSLYPSILSLGLKFFTLATTSKNEERNTRIDRGA